MPMKILMKFSMKNIGVNLIKKIDAKDSFKFV